jgi:inorganic triphosphatase YgiF
MEAFLQESGMPYKKKSKSSLDTYYDTKNHALYAKDCSLRRKISSKGKVKLTLKRPISNDLGMMSREEIEIMSDGSLESLKEFAAPYFPGLKIADMPALTVLNTRTAFEYKDGSGIKLSIDDCRYVDGHNTLDFYEIELESMDGDIHRGFDTIGILDFISSDLGFKLTVQSKYSRGIAWKGE